MGEISRRKTYSRKYISSNKYGMFSCETEEDPCSLDELAIYIYLSHGIESRSKEIIMWRTRKIQGSSASTTDFILLSLTLHSGGERDASG